MSTQFARGTIVCLDSSGREVTDRQPVELWVESYSGDSMTMSVRHEPLTVHTAAVVVAAHVYDADGVELWSTPSWERQLGPLWPGSTVRHSPPAIVDQARGGTEDK